MRTRKRFPLQPSDVSDDAWAFVTPGRRSHVPAYGLWIAKFTQPPHRRE